MILRSIVTLLLVQRHLAMNIQLSKTNDVGTFPSQNIIHGEPQRCITRNKDLVQLEIIPGIGWDNLRNREEGQLIQNNYTMCRTTGDGQFLIPDTVFTIPVRQSSRGQIAELFDHWQDFTSTISSSINVNAGLYLKDFGISGGFSYEKENVRLRQVHDLSSTTRVQLRYVSYTTKLQPDSQLHQSFKSRLLRIAFYIQSNNSAMANYESQLLVRDFGTHVITSVDAGALLVQTDQIKSSFSKSSGMDKVLASASASFMGVFHTNTSVGHAASKETTGQYLGNRTHSAINTFGGPPIKPDKFNVDGWIDAMSNNLVAVDKSGEPIYFLITPLTLPELPALTVYQLQLTVARSVSEYYKQNVYRGCTNAESPNFSLQANVEDGTCESPTANYSFGGVYQTCERSESISHNLCADLEQKNPLTGAFSCPEGYESFLFDSSIRYRFKSYWCAASGEIKQNQGFLFGGLYTSKVVNLLTESHSCPLFFYPLKISADLYVCASDDYERGRELSVPFAGFFSCISGNPLKLHEQLKYKESNISLLDAYTKSSGSKYWPMECPSGYSQYLAAVSNTCEINYCIKAHVIKTRKLPKIKLPPFMKIPGSGFTNEYSSYKISDDSSTWHTLQGNSTEMYDSNKIRPQYDVGMSKGTVAALSIAGAVVFLVSLVLVVTRIRISQSGNKSRYTGRKSDVLIPRQD